VPFFYLTLQSKKKSDLLFDEKEFLVGKFFYKYLKKNIMSKYNIFKIRHLALFTIIIFAQITVLAQNIPAGYYDSAEGKVGAALKTALFEKIKNPTFWQGKYSNAASFFNVNDRAPAIPGFPNGYIWDMYSDIKLPNWIGTGTDALNREHNLPKSWFGVSSGSEDTFSIGCDYNNLYPSNAKANSAKSNYPLGEVNMNLTVTFNNGVSKVGKSSIPINNGAYNGSVFEPADEYKGDFARNYMYMVTCYEDYAQKWTTSYGMTMLENNTFPTFTTYSINLLMKWHRQDPVSQKEIDRNEAVYSVQGNRNPFVDHPEYAEYIWGDQEPPITDTFSVGYQNLYVDSKIVGEIIIYGENLTNCQFNLYSLMGNIVLSDKIGEDGKIDVSRLPFGLYILEVYSTSNATKYVTKIILQEFRK